MRVFHTAARAVSALGLGLLVWSCSARTGADAADTLSDGPVGKVEQHLGSWMLTWIDDFDGTSLNRDNWQPMNLAAGTFNSEWQTYVDQEGSTGTFDVAGDGILRIYMRYNGGGAGGYKSARIVSKNKVEKSQGAWQTRVKFWKSSTAGGLWPAVWFLGHNINQTPILHSDEAVCWPMYNPNDPDHGGAANEIDLAEFVSNTNVLQGNFIKDWGAGCEVYDSRNLVTPLPSDFYNWHTYRLEWQGDYARLMVDGAVMRTLSPSEWRGVWDNKYFALMNLAIGGTLGQAVSFGPNDSAGLAIDYVAHYAWEDSPNFPDANQSYKLKSVWDNYVLTAKDRNGDSTRATMAIDNNWSSQRWKFVSAGNGSYYIRSVWSGQDLVMKDESGDYNAPPFNTTMDAPASVASHQFQLIRDSAGKYTFVSGYGMGLTSVQADSDSSRNFRRGAGRSPDATKPSHRWIVSQSD